MRLQQIWIEVGLQARSNSQKVENSVIIRNVTRQVRDEQLNAFDQHREPPISELSFSSDFECGNLHFVFKERKQQTYYLLLQNDVNTHGFNFWFFFNIRSKTPRKCTFIIVNLSRPVCFQKDVSILTYSVTKKLYQRKIGFNTEISQFRRCDEQQNYWSLLFEYQFDYDDDVYFSLALPYTYSKTINFLKGLSLLTKNHFFFIDLVGKSPLGNMIPMIKIFKQHRNCKRFVFITARQHPSETVSSFVCESIIKKLITKNSFSNSLLQRFKFIILPMVNVDGVIHGNSRTNLMGYDLNRCWGRSGIMQSIECQQIWKQIQNIQAQGNIAWSLDLHGHSKEHGFFAYFSEQNQKSLVMSHHLTKNRMFRANKCVYEVGASKRQSIRGQISQRMKNKNSVTIQISLFGSYDQNQLFFHFQSTHFDQIATSILQSMLQTQKLSEKKMFQLKNWQQIINKMGQTHQNDKEVDSDSNPQGDYLKKQQRIQVQELLEVSTNQRHKSQYKLIPSQHEFTRKRAKTKIDQISKQKSYSQRISPIKKNNPVNNLTKIEKKLNSPQVKPKLVRSQLFNITYTNRFRSSNKCVIIQSHDFYSHPNMVNAWYDERAQKIQYKQQRRSPPILNNNPNEVQASLKKSADIRKRMKFAFQRRHKTQSQRETSTSNLIGPQNICRISAIVYPTVREKEMIDLHNNLKSKRQLTKELRNQSFGMSVHHHRFQNSFNLKSKNP